MEKNKRNKEQEESAAHAEKEINEFFYEDREDEGKPLDYLDRGTTAINIEKYDEE